MLKSKRMLVILVGALLFGAFSVARAAVEIAYFEGEWDDGEVLLEWETGSEVDHSGFHVWRSDQDLAIQSGQIDTDDATRITTSVIRNPDGSCSIDGQTYQLTDDDLAAGTTTYYYYLESFNCTNGSSMFYGNDANTGGLRVASPDAPTVTPTRTTQPSNTPAPSNTPQSDNTPAPTNTPQPGQTSVAATSTPAPSASATTSVAATRTAAPSATQATSSAPTATRAPIATTTFAPAPTIEQAPPEQEEEAPLPTVVVPTTAPQGAAQSSAPTPSPTLALAAEITLSPQAEVTSGPMEGQLVVATPTVVSVFGAGGAAPVDEPLVAEVAQQQDGLDRVIQGIVALILLGVVALVGFIGWSYAKQRR